MSMSLAKQHSFLACAGMLSLLTEASAAEWHIAPAATMLADYTDNPRLLGSDGISTVGRVAELSATLLARTETMQWSLLPKLRSSRYTDDEALGSDDQYLDAGWQLATQRTTWSANAGYVRDRTLTSELQ